jgi:hypothetical protein
MGRDIVSNLRTLDTADLEQIALAIIHSPIIMRRTALEARLADWETTRRSDDVDEVVLAWIAMEASQRRRARLS